jgi:DNA replication and repair protein RecF
VGEFPSVILSPEQGGIATGGPGERRRFLDLVLCQTSRSYLEDLMEYRRVLRQRNKILADARFLQTPVSAAIEPWNEGLAAFGSRVMMRRREFLNMFEPLVQEAYTTIAGGTEKAEARYIPTGSVPESDSADDVRRWLASELERKQAEEIRRGTTLTGPHRDDMRLTIRSLDVHKFASQGEQKSLLIALKLAEYRYVEERKGERPLLLLDDVFSELDRERAAQVLRQVAGLGQSAITATSTVPFEHVLADELEQRTFMVEHGTCRPI